MRAVLLVVRILLGTLYLAFIFLAVTMSFLYSNEILGVLGIKADGSAGTYLAGVVLVVLVVLYLVFPRFGLDRSDNR